MREPTEYVEEPIKKRATWRIVLTLLNLIITVFFFYFVRFEIFRGEPPLSEKLLVPVFLASHIITIVVAVSLKVLLLPTGIENFVLNCLLLFLPLLLEWFFYGWLLDTWLYRRRLKTAGGLGAKTAR